MWQAEQVRARLAALYPGTAIGVLGVPPPVDGKSDAGDRATMFRDLEAAMADGRADLAVHPLKNVPAELSPGFTIAGITAREDPRDAFVSNRHGTLASLPAGAVVGTSSLRREAQLRERFPSLEVRPLRGNVNTRLRKLDEGQYDAIILAAAGLKRLGFGDRIADLIDPADSLPAPGQGALAIECRADRRDLLGAVGPLADRATTLATTAERAFSRALAGNCRTPLAAHGEWLGERLWLRGLVASADGREVMRGEVDEAIEGVEAADALGGALADDFLARGAARFMTE